MGLDYHRLHQFIQFKVIADHVDTARQLLTLGRATHRLGITATPPPHHTIFPRAPGQEGESVHILNPPGNVGRIFCPPAEKRGRVGS